MSHNPSLNEEQSDVHFSSSFDEAQLHHVHYFHYEGKQKEHIHLFYVINEIFNVEFYIFMINTIRMMNPEDKTFMYFNSSGGDVDIGMQIINAMNESAGEITTVLDSKAHSIAAVMFLSGHVRIVQPNSIMMLHNYSATLRGKGHELVQSINGFNASITQLMFDAIGTFLTDEERGKLIDGKDFWFTSKEVSERLSLCEENRQLDELEEEKQLLLESVAEIEQRLKEIDEIISEDGATKPSENDTGAN